MFHQMSMFGATVVMLTTFVFALGAIAYVRHVLFEC
jgi:hypothetical protein